MTDHRRPRRSDIGAGTAVLDDRSDGLSMVVSAEVAPGGSHRQTEQEQRDKAKADALRRFLIGNAVLDLPPPDPMVGEYLDRRVIASMPGKFGSGKSFVLLDLALSVASGVPWLGQEIHHRGPAWYVMAEGAYTASPRVRAWSLRHDRPVPDSFLLYPDRFDLSDSGTWAGLRWAMEDAIADGLELPALIVLDTYSQLISGDEKPDTTKAALESMYVMRDLTGAAIIFAHHTGHNVTGRGRGDSTLEDNIDVVLPIEGRLHDENGRSVPVALTNTKQKARPPLPPLWYQVAEVDDPDGGQSLPYVEPTAKPDGDPANGDGRPDLIRLWEYICEHEGQYRSRQLGTNEPVGIEALRIPTRRRQELVAQLATNHCIEVVKKEGQQELLGRGPVSPFELADGPPPNVEPF